jgi:protein associated with RNAse G/E
MPFKLAKVESFKYQDTPRYFLPCAVVSDTPECLTIFHPAGAPFWSGRDNKVYRMDSHSLNLLFPDRDYNVVFFWNLDWTFSAYYVNIALPVEWDGEFCRYIDLDLDVLYVTESSYRRPGNYDQPGVYILDRDEYEERKVLFNYPPEIMARAEEALEVVQRQIALGAFPFDGSLLNWRPDADLMGLVEWPDKTAIWHLNS